MKLLYMKDKKNITITIITLAIISYGFVSYAQEVDQNTDIEIVQEEQEVLNNDQVQEQPEDVSEIEEEQEEQEEISTKKLKRPERALKTLDSFDYSVSRLQNISGRISNKITKLEEQGVSVGTARNQIKQANNLIRNSFGKLKKVKEQTKKFIAAGAYEQGYVDIARDELAVIANDGSAAQKVMQEIITNLIKQNQNLNIQEDSVQEKEVVDQDQEEKTEETLLQNSLINSVSNLLESEE